MGKEYEYKEKQVTQKEVYIETLRCDRCKKVIYKKYGDKFDDSESLSPKQFLEYKKPVSYYVVTTGHNDWGNDSCESVDRKVVCPKCLTEEYSEYVNNINNANIWNTMYMNIEHEANYTIPELLVPVDHTTPYNFFINSASWQIQREDANGPYKVIAKIDCMSDDSYLCENIRTGKKYVIDDETITCLASHYPKYEQSDLLVGMVAGVGDYTGYPCITKGD